MEKMVFVKDGYTFVKAPGANVVNVYVGDFLEGEQISEVDVFTDYSIGDSFYNFSKSCNEHLEYMQEAY
jgi:hypothetical protein